jgi:hypothetical protein
MMVDVVVVEEGGVGRGRGTWSFLRLWTRPTRFRGTFGQKTWIINLPPRVSRCHRLRLQQQQQQKQQKQQHGSLELTVLN